MSDFLFWLYFCNAVLLIIHEIDSAYWKEWELFHLPGGITGFLLLHFPLLAVILYGLIEVRQESRAGLIFSLVLSLGGIFAFAIHTYFIRKGRPEFKTPMSLGILIAILVLSVVQSIVTLRLQSGCLP
jgi:hypothetical protein